MKASDVEAKAKAAFGPQTEYRETEDLTHGERVKVTCVVHVYGRPKLSASFQHRLGDLDMYVEALATATRRQMARALGAF